MNTYTLDVSAMATRDDVYAALAELFQFPDYFGCNADALYDCLTDLPEPGTLVMNGVPAGEEAAKTLSVCACVFRDACWTVCGEAAEDE